MAVDEREESGGEETPPAGPERAPNRWLRILKVAVAIAIAAALLYLVVALAATGQLFLAIGLLGTAGIGFYVYLARPAYTWRYLFPGILGMLVFVILPLLYTVRLGFTNYSSSNLLTFQRATQYFLDQTVDGPGKTYEFEVRPEKDGKVRLVLKELAPEPPASDEDEATEGKEQPPPAQPAAPTPTFATEGFDPAKPPDGVDAKPLDPDAASKLAAPLELREIVELKAALSTLRVKFPDGSQARMASLREFGPLQPLYQPGEKGTLVNTQTHEALTPDPKIGFYVGADGKPVRPGFKVDVGFANYLRVLTDRNYARPLGRIFVWTVAFALLTVLLTLVVGMTLAVVLNWEALPGRTVYRTLLFLPYAVPGFISILVFRGIFNTSSGELNAMLTALFGSPGSPVQPPWLSDPWLAKAVILVVNTWLGYPYIMVLATGLIKAIPGDLYEASAMAGAGPLQTFRHVTAPLIIRPLTPLLISSFAFNFNNFVLISLLTQGRPDFLDARVPAGTTDILVSFTYRLAFQDSGQRFGLAAAVSTVIFFIVAGLSLVNLRLTRGRVEGQPR